MKKEENNKPIVKILSFQKESPVLTLKDKKKKPMQFEFGFLYFQLSEMKNGFVPSKIFKTTSKGTKLEFVPISEESMKKFQESFSEQLKEFINKWKVDPTKKLFEFAEITTSKIDKE